MSIVAFTSSLQSWTSLPSTPRKLGRCKTSSTKWAKASTRGPAKLGLFLGGFRGGPHPRSEMNRSPRSKRRFLWIRYVHNGSKETYGYSYICRIYIYIYVCVYIYIYISWSMVVPKFNVFLGVNWHPNCEDKAAPGQSTSLPPKLH